ncbi:MAG: ATP-binding cassette domain-containing protein [Bacteroidales bacterium]|jgi:ABC-type multidrug transport system ATPase subunit|nr:ATP-binding cassette domain-containing protein [Bacteroidales bacterium]
MTYKTLNHIITLFAITINKNNSLDLEKTKQYFFEFISKTIEFQYIDEFVEKFDESLNLYSSFSSHKRTSLNSVKLLRICEEIKENLPENERVSILFYLLTLIKNFPNNNNSIDFIKLISESFEIENNISEIIFDLIISGDKSNSKFLEKENEQIASIFQINQQLIIFVPEVKNIKINNFQSEPQKFYLLEKNDVILYKSYKYYFQDLISEQKNKEVLFNYSIRDLEIRIKNNILFHKISIDFKNGELIGIIGKSGSGKTSFLKTIAGMNKNYSGELKISNNNITQAFVEQQNSFIPLFTVEEHLHQRTKFLAIPYNESKILIKDILNAVNLTNKRKNISIHSNGNNFQLSGGQQKRLAIAMELLTNPDILLLDEPTSGLASNDAINIISILRKLANQNKLVIASIHQPDYETFQTFDKILIIDDNGFPVFFGSPTSSIQYFRTIFHKIDKNSILETNFNPSILLNLIDQKKIGKNGIQTTEREKTPQELYQIFTAKNQISDTPNNQNITKQKNKKYSTSLLKSIFQQITLSLKIDFKNKIRIILLTIIPIIIGTLFSFLTYHSSKPNYSYYFNKNIPIWFLIILISAVFIGLVSAAHEFVFLKNFHKVENLLINKNFSLTISKLIKYLTVSAFQSFLMVFPAVFILNISFHFRFLFIIVWILIFWGNLISLIFSKLVKNISTIYLIIPLIIIPQMIFSGAMINFENFNKYYPKYSEIPIGASLIPTRWAAEATMTNFFIHNEYQQKIFSEKQLFYEAAYNLNFVIPELKNIYNTDSLKTKKIIYNTFINNRLSPTANNINNSILQLEKYFLVQKKNYQSLIDEKTANSEIAEKFTNLSINKILLQNQNSEHFKIKQEKFIRNYLPIYEISNSFYDNSKFLIGTKQIGNYNILSYNYNILILIFYNLILSILLLIIKKK